MEARGPQPLPGFRAGFGRQLDPLLRQPVETVYSRHFEPEEARAYAGSLARSEALAAWLTAPVLCAEGASP
jgi:hypothetical protein